MPPPRYFVHRPGSPGRTCQIPCSNSLPPRESSRYAFVAAPLPPQQSNRGFAETLSCIAINFTLKLLLFAVNSGPLSSSHAAKGALRSVRIPTWEPWPQVALVSLSREPPPHSNRGGLRRTLLP